MTRNPFCRHFFFSPLCVLLVICIQVCSSEPARSISLDNPDSLYNAAVRLQKDNRLVDAKHVLRRLLDQFPQHTDGRSLYAHLLAWENDNTASLSQYDSVLVFDQKHPEARAGKALVLAWSNRFKESITMLEELTLEYPRSAEYQSELAQVYVWSGDDMKAYQHYEKSWRLENASVGVVRGLARLAVKLEDDSLSLYWYGRLVESSPWDIEAQNELKRLSYRSKHEVQIQYSNESFGRLTIEPQRTLSAEYYYELSPNWKPYVHLEQPTKFAQTDKRFGLGVYGRPSYRTGLFAQFLYTSAANFSPRIDAVGELNFPLFDGLEASLGYRLLSFDSSNVNLLFPALTIYVADVFWITSKVYVSQSSTGDHSTSFTLTGYYRPNLSILFQATIFNGRESFRAATLNEATVYESKGILINLKDRVYRMLAFVVSYQFSTRQPIGDSHLVSIGFSFLF